MGDYWANVVILYALCNIGIALGSQLKGLGCRILTDIMLCIMAVIMYEMFKEMHFDVWPTYGCGFICALCIHNINWRENKDETTDKEEPEKEEK